MIRVTTIRVNDVTMWLRFGFHYHHNSKINQKRVKLTYVVLYTKIFSHVDKNSETVKN